MEWGLLKLPCIDAPGSGGNDFWVMRFDIQTLTWKHLSQFPGHSLEADFDCEGVNFPLNSHNWRL